MKVFDNIKLLIVVLLPLSTGLYGFLLGAVVGARMTSSLLCNSSSVQHGAAIAIMWSGLVYL